MSDTEALNVEEKNKNKFAGVENSTEDNANKDLTLGDLLSHRRKYLGITLDEVASELNLRVSLLEDIEADRLSLDLSSTYSKGYIKSYAYKLGLSFDDISDLLETGFKEKRYFQNFSELKNNPPKNKNYLFISFLFAGGLITSYLIYYLFSLFK